MVRKTTGFTAVIAAIAFTVFAGQRIPGANIGCGASSPEHRSRRAGLTEEVVPVFVEKEVVQGFPRRRKPTRDSPPPGPSLEGLRELVATMPATGSLSEEMQCLAGAVYFESRGEPLAGQLAVAQVIINRAEDRRFPSGYCGVVFQRSQFSFVKNGHMPRIRTGTLAWKRAQAVARIAHRGMWDSEASDALYFHANYVRPSWSRRKVALATIDTHVFYGVSLFRKGAVALAAAAFSLGRSLREFDPNRGMVAGFLAAAVFLVDSCGLHAVGQARATAAGGRCGSRDRAATRRPGNPNRSTRRRAG